jgi:cytochrome P450
VCVGHHLARAEVGEALRQLVRAVPDLRLVSAEQETPQPFAHPVATYRVGEVVVAWG